MSLTDGDDYEGNPADIPHVAVELEVALPAQGLVSPLHYPAPTPQGESLTHHSTHSVSFLHSFLVQTHMHMHLY